ncbi:hypothetical protein [Marispirochaeta sp.]|uniref:hypothetical protein n=1 Tax=Marispirochaeta sp. TaxID=2038653 RepID=UPI0029C74AFA|nr:hypothetical protein [Marispirochaeta sp.]
MKLNKRRLTGILGFLLLLSGSLLHSQEYPLRVAVFPFSTPSDDPGLESLAEAAADTLVLTLQLLERYAVDRYSSPSPFDTENVFQDLRQKFVDYAVYGEIEILSQGGYRIRAFSWDSLNDAATLAMDMEAASVFDLFDVMDLAAVSLAEEFTGTHIGFGRLVFDKQTPGLSYRVEIDGNSVGENLFRREVLYGQRKISIFLLPGEEANRDYHLVSYLLKIEEGREYHIPVTIEPGLDLKNWNEGIEPPVPIDGSNIITSRPRAAAVYAGDELLGRTPLVADPMYLSLGTPLRMERDYFLPLDSSLQQPNQLFDLYPNPQDPAIQPTMKRVWLGAATNVLLTAGQMAFMFLPGVEDGPPPWPMMLAAAPRFGYALHNDLMTSGILSAASAASLGLIMWADEMRYMEDDLSIILWQVPFWSLVLYDLIAPPFFAAADNRASLRRIKEEGLPEAEKRRRPWISKPYTSAQVGGGAYFMAGAGFDAMKEFFSFDLYAGISGDYFEPLKPIPSATAKMLLFPAAPFDIPVKPYAAALIHAGMKDREFSGAVGPALGIEIPTDLPRLPKMTVFFEAEYFFSPVGGFPMIGFGVKLK